MDKRSYSTSQKGSIALVSLMVVLIIIVVGVSFYLGAKYGYKIPANQAIIQTKSFVSPSPTSSLPVQGAWTTYKIQNIFQFDYPIDKYSVRSYFPSGKQVVFPGGIEIDTNDSYHEKSINSFTIIGTSNKKHLTLNDVTELAGYDPKQYQLITTPLKIDSRDAIKVEGIPGVVSSTSVFIILSPTKLEKDGLIYEINYRSSDGNIPSKDNQEITDRIINSFKILQ